MRSYTKTAVALAVALGVAPGVVACGDGERRAGTPAAVGVQVSAPVVERAALEQPATVVAERRASLATRLSGTVRSVSVDVGARVDRGDALLVLDDADVTAAVEQARVAAELARRSHGRIERLEAQGAATRQELDEAEARLRTAESRLAESLAQLDYVVLRAPFDGVVTERHADPGDLAVPGRPLLVVQASAPLDVVAELPASLTGTISEGDTVRVVEPATGFTAPARVTRVVPALDAASRRFRVEARLEAGSGLLPGQYVRLELGAAGDPSVWIPESAVVRRGQLTGVRVVEAGTLRLRWIRPGRSRDGLVEALAGVAPDARVVVSVDGAPVDGAPVAQVRHVSEARTDGAATPSGGTR